MQCPKCGDVLAGAGGACARCERIDAILAAPYEPPPSIVIPGPPSLLENTLSSTGPPAEDLARFASPAPERQALPDEIECPRCVEKIKARAKACRFCGHELGARTLDRDTKPENVLPRRGSSGRHRAVADATDRRRPARQVGSKGFPVVPLVFVLCIAVVGFFLLVETGNQPWDDDVTAEAKRRIRPWVEEVESSGHHISDDDLQRLLERAKEEVRRERAARDRVNRAR